MRLIFWDVSLQTLDWAVWEVAIPERAVDLRTTNTGKQIGQLMGRAWFISRYCLIQNGNVHVFTAWKGIVSEHDVRAQHGQLFRGAGATWTAKYVISLYVTRQ
jgi:hypothetical protein